MVSIEAIKNAPGLFHLRRRRYRARFLHAEFGTFWGRFPSFDEALASLPPAIASSYDNEDLVTFHVDQFLQVLPFDWPVLFFLSRGLADGSIRSLIDFGGHIGVKYLAYRDLLALPDDFRWCVCDLPPMVKEGRRRAAAQGLPHLAFFEDVAEAGPVDLLLCSGALQFCPFPVGDVIRRCAVPPPVLILNKMPYCRDGGFVTLENFNRVKVAYQVFDRESHDSALADLGYRLERRWRIPHRDFEIPYARPRLQAKMFGEIWRLAGTVP